MLVRPDGSHTTITKKNKHFETTRQCHAGWQRAILLMKEYGIWDATAFGCTMNTILCVDPGKYENEKKVLYLFSTCQHAERAVYPFLPEEAVKKCRENVDAFYADPNLQAAWNRFILHPVCLKIKEGGRKYTPIFLGDIGEGEGVLGNYTFSPISSIEEKRKIKEIMHIGM